MVIDGGVSPVVQQAMSDNLASSQLIFAANGSNWSISLNSAPTKCLDAGKSGSAAPITLQTCKCTSTSQQWTITPQGNTYGAFLIKNVAGGNYLALTNPGSTTLQRSAGVPFDVEPYNRSDSTQQYRIQAVATVN